MAIAAASFWIVRRGDESTKYGRRSDLLYTLSLAHLWARCGAYVMPQNERGGWPHHSFLHMNSPGPFKKKALGSVQLWNLMAIRSAWWMREPVAAQLDRASRRASSTTHHLHPYQKWPKQAPDGLSFNELERYLHENAGTYCSIYKLSYSYDAGGKRAKWGRNRNAKSTDELHVFLLEQASHLMLIQRQ